MDSTPGHLCLLLTVYSASLVTVYLSHSRIMAASGVHVVTVMEMMVGQGRDDATGDCMFTFIMTTG